jgi:hypothetical protein
MGIVGARNSRLAGLLYLVVVAAGMFCLAYVPSRVATASDPLAGIATHASLYRQGIAAFMVMEIAFLSLGLVLYRHFCQIGPQASRFMLAFVVASVPLALVALTCRLDLLALSTDPGIASAQERPAAAAASMRACGHTLLVTKLFWGLWLLPLGLLIIRTKAIPRLLGALLLLGGAGYLFEVFASVLLPGYAGSSLAGHVRLPAAAGEIGTCMWLLVVGMRPAADVSRH